MTVNERVDNDSPADKLVVTVHVPERIWTRDLVLSANDRLAAAQNSADSICAAQRVEDASTLHLQAKSEQMPAYETIAGARADAAILDNDRIQSLVGNARE